MVLAGQVIEEPFHISQLQTAEITEADGTANVWSDIWKFQNEGHRSIYIQRLLDTCTTTQGYRVDDIMEGKYG